MAAASWRTSQLKVMNERSAAPGVVVAIIQIIIIAAAAALSWHVYARASLLAAGGGSAWPGSGNTPSGEIRSGEVSRSSSEGAAPLNKRQEAKSSEAGQDTPLLSKSVVGQPETLTANNLAPLLPPNQDEVINGLALADFLLMPPGVMNHVRAIFERGQALGNNPHAFSKLGDSTIEHPYFLSRFDSGPYELGQYKYLAPFIEKFSGSFSREAITVKRGFHSWSALNPMWADKSVCLANETPLGCEFRLHQPSYLFIRLGSNDADVPASFDRHMRLIIEYALEHGVVPIVGTKADRVEGDGNEINGILYRIAA